MSPRSRHWGAIAHVRLGQQGQRPSGCWSAPCRNAKRSGTGWNTIYLQVALTESGLGLGDVPAALIAARRAVGAARESSRMARQAPRCGVLGQACEAAGDRGAADEAFRQSVEVLEATQSRPELAQTLLAYGRFQVARRRPRGKTD